MNATTSSKSRQQVERFVKLVEPFDANGENAVLQIRMVKGVRVKKEEVFTYWCDKIGSDFGDGFRLEKQGVCGDKENDTYHVNLDNAGHICTCKGFERFGHCKHCDCLIKLRELGMI